MSALSEVKSGPITMAIVLGCSKPRLADFHLGHTPYGGSKVPCRFLSLDTLWRSHFRPYMEYSWPGWLGHFAFRRLGVSGLEPRHRVTVWHQIRWWISSNRVQIWDFLRTPTPFWNACTDQCTLMWTGFILYISIVPRVITFFFFLGGGELWCTYCMQPISTGFAVLNVPWPFL